MQSSPIQVNQIPRLLNEKFAIVSYDGGVFAEDGGISSHLDIRNVLVPTRDTFHCSESGIHKNLVLKCSSDFTLTHIFIQAPRRKCTEPIRNCLAWISETEPCVDSTRFFDEIPMDVIKKKYSDSDPIIISTSSETLEGEAEIRPWRAGRYIHLKLFDSHSETQENVDVAVIGLVGFVGRVPFYNPITNQPMGTLGPWCKRQFSPPRTVHSHTLTATFSNRGWCCDGRDFSGGCRGGFNDFNETSVYDVSFRCSICGFDLCEFCVGCGAIGKVTTETATTDINLVSDANNRSAQVRRMALNRIKTSLKIDSDGFIMYLRSGLIEKLARVKFPQSRESVSLLVSVLSRLCPSPIGSGRLFVPDIYVNIETKDIVMIGENASIDSVPFTVLSDGGSGTTTASMLIPISNTEDVVLSTASLFSAARSGERPLALDELIRNADLTIPNGEGKTLIEVSQEHRTEWLGEVIEKNHDEGHLIQEDEISMDIEEDVGAPSTPRIFKTRVVWLSELRHRVCNRMIDQLVESEIIDADLLSCLLELNTGFGEKIRFLLLRLLTSNNTSEISTGLRLIMKLLEKSREDLIRFGTREWMKKISQMNLSGEILSLVSSIQALLGETEPGCNPGIDLLRSVTAVDGGTEAELVKEIVKKKSLDENQLDALCEYLLLKEDLPVRKIVSEERSVARQGFSQLTTPINLKLNDSVVETPVEPITCLSDIARLAVASLPVVDYEYIKYCYELVGCVIDIKAPLIDPVFTGPVSGVSSPRRASVTGPSSPIQTSSGRALVTGFEIISDLNLGFHSLRFDSGSSSSSGKRQVLLALREYTVVSRESPVAPFSELKARVTFERLKDPSCVGEFRVIRSLLDRPGELVVIENQRSTIHNILQLVGLNHSPRGWLVPQESLPTESLVVLDSCFRFNNGGISSPTMSPTRSPEPVIDETKIFSVGIHVDLAEIPLELIWPMIRDEVFESIRPFLRRSWPNLTNLIRVEQQITAGITGPSGQGIIARGLSQAEADSLARRVGNVVQATVIEDRSGAIQAETERISSQGRPQSPWLGASPSSRSVSQRVRWTPPSMMTEDKWLFGIIASVKESSYDVIDEASGSLYFNVPKACIGGGLGGMRQRLRESIRRRFMDIGILGGTDFSVPTLLPVRNEGGLLHAFTRGVQEEQHPEDDEDEEEEENDDDEYTHLMAEEYDAAMEGMEEGGHPTEFTSESGSSPRRRPHEDESSQQSASMDDFNIGRGGGSDSGILITIGDLLAGIGLGGIEVSTATSGSTSSETIMREIPGIARGSSLNAPIGERYTADDWRKERESVIQDLRHPSSRVEACSVIQRPLLKSWMRVAGTGKEWFEVSDTVTPLISLLADGSEQSIVVPKSLNLEFRLTTCGSSITESSSSIDRDTKRQRLFSPNRMSNKDDLFMVLLEYLENKVESRKVNERYQILKTVIVSRVVSQLDQTLLIVADSLMMRSDLMIPSWLQEVSRKFLDLVPETVRQKVFLYTSLGPSLTVNWLQSNHLSDLMNRRSQIQTDLNTESSGENVGGRRMQFLSQELSNIEDRIVRNPWWFGCIESCLAKLRKSDHDEFIQMSSSLLERIARSPSMLEIQFEGESGFGSAVTRSFFSEIGKEFVKKGKDCLWITDDDDSSEFVSAAKRGLRFRPNPHPNLDRCMMFGRLLGRAMAEGYIIPLPISVETWSVIRDTTCARDISLLPMPGDGTSGEFVGACAQLVKRLEEGEDDFDRIWTDIWRTSQVRFEDIGAVFVETGFSGQPLVTNGDQVAVTRSNVSEFVKRAAHQYLFEGIEAQISSIRKGIDEVVPVDSLLLFKPLELKTLICGEDDIVWDEESLKGILQFHDTIGSSELHKWLIEILVELNNQERSTFLDFVTSCPRLPPGGHLKIEVFNETIASSNLTSPVLRPAKPPVVGTLTPIPSVSSSSGEASPVGAEEVIGYPRSRACVNHLYLPRYKSRQTLKDRLIEAMVSSVHHDEITG